MTSVPFSGAVDLAALSAAKEASQRRAQAPGNTVELTEANANEIIQSSVSKPVFVLLCSVRAPQCAELETRVAAILAEYGDAVTFATVDVETQPQLAQAFQVNAVPAMLAILGGRPAPLFQGAPDDEQLRDVIGQVVDVARQAGMAMPVAAEAGPVDPPEAPLPPLHQEAIDAIDRDDFDAAIAAYDKALKENPRDAEAKAGRAQVALLARQRGAEPGVIRTAAADRPDDAAAQMAVADLDVLGGAVADAFDRLLDLIARLASDEREPVRQRLIELFEVIGPTDARVVSARQRLASLLY